MTRPPTELLGVYAGAIGKRYGTLFRDARLQATLPHVNTSETGNQPPAPNPVGTKDISALIGWLVTIEGEMMVGDIPQWLVDRLHDRLVGAGLLSAESSAREMRQVLSDMNYRLRYAIGELEQPPEPYPVPH